jgi:methanogenic corrinoid protein MtbC1
MKSTYSTAELATMFDVNESTVKRWSDSGDLHCVKTRGGHRRYDVASVLDFVQRNKLSVPVLDVGIVQNEDLQAHVIAGNIGKLGPELKKGLLAGNTEAVLKLIRLGFAAKPNLLALYTQLIFPPLIELGNEWEQGTITIHEEHIASNTLRDALARFQREVHHKPSNGFTAVCACYDGELHDIALRCISYYLEAQGWNTLFLGQSVPTESLMQAVKKHKPQLVVLTGNIIPKEKKFVKDVNGTIYPTVRRMKAKLAVGGYSFKKRFGERVKADFISDSIADYEQIADPNQY